MPVDSIDLSDILEKIEKDWKISGKITSVYTPNAEIVTFGYFNSRFQKIVEKFDLAIPDGTLLVWAGNVLGQPISRRITGGLIMEKLVSYAAKKNVPIALIGGTAGVAELALKCLQKRHPGLHGLSDQGPTVANEEDFVGDSQNSLQREIKRLAQKIVKTNTRFVFVAMGCPKQELFMEQLKFKIQKSKIKNSLVLMAVGGVFDVLAGRVKPAPEWISNSGFEWLWRLIQEPWRLKRQLKLPLFVLLVLFDTLRKISQKSRLHLPSARADGGQAKVKSQK